MDIEKEIELLESLEGIPMPPDPAPIPSAYEGFVQVPIQIAEYFESIEVELSMNEDRKMKTEDYLNLMKEYSIRTAGPVVIYVVRVGKENTENNQ